MQTLTKDGTIIVLDVDKKGSVFMLKKKFYGWNISDSSEEAYSIGEKPIKEWTKKNILDLCEESGFTKNQLVNVMKIQGDELKNMVLKHSSNHENTPFYSVDKDALISLKNVDIQPSLLDDVRLHEKKKKPVLCQFIEWTIHNNVLIPIEKISQGCIVGSWFWPDDEDDVKYSTQQDGFNVLKWL